MWITKYHSGDGMKPGDSIGRLPILLRTLLQAGVITGPFTTLALVFFASHWLLHGAIANRTPLAPDARVLWTAGQLAGSGQLSAAYDVETFNRIFDESMAGPPRRVIFAYPPTILPVLVAWSKFPYRWALTVLEVVSLTTFFIGIYGTKFSDWRLILGILAPTVTLNLFLGQLGLVCAGLAVGGLRLSARHPRFAGVLVGLLSIKPILGICIPALLLARRRYITLGVAGAFTLGLALIPSAIWGWGCWDVYLHGGLHGVHAMLDGSKQVNGNGLTSILRTVEWVGGNAREAVFVQYLWSLGTAALFGFYLHRTRAYDAILPADLVVVAGTTLLILPYVHAYDGAWLEASLIVFATSTRDEWPPRVTWPQRLVLLILWLSSLIAAVLVTISIALAPILLLVGVSLFTLWMIGANSPSSSQQSIAKG